MSDFESEGRQGAEPFKGGRSGAARGIYAANRLSARMPGLIFREQCGGDTGLNAHLEVIEEYPKMGKRIGLQIRDGSGPTGGMTAERTARGYVCRGEMAHVAYWLQHALPVLVMVHEGDRLLWEAVSPDTLEITGQYWELLVPSGQVYDEDALGRIVDLPCYSPYLARLALDRPWMQLIDAGKGILLELDEWVNQPMARDSLRLSVLSGDTGAGEVREAVYEWPFETNPDMPHAFRLPSLFPWADIAVDSAFYRERGVEVSLGLAPWTVEAGEIARFRLRLSLNGLGRAFLTTEQFLRRGEFPSQWGADRGFGPDYEEGLKFRLYQGRP